MSNNYFEIQVPYIKKYYPPPPLINASLIYQDINNDKKLRENVTTYFLKKCIKWCSIYAKKNIGKLKTTNGTRLFSNSEGIRKEGLLCSSISIVIVYKLLREFVKKNDYNWYDLRTLHYNLLKQFLINKLTLI
jgi:hypothetical protein